MAHPPHFDTDEAPRAGGPRVWLERLGLVLFGTVLALGLLELALAGLALFHGHRETALPTTGEQVILTVGDSHTYGIFMSPEDAYPGRLQAELDAVAAGRYRVVNLGLPGMNSSTLVARMPGWIERFRPSVVVVCAGVNNVWNSSDVETATQRNDGGFLSRFVSGLRIVRLLRLYRFAWADRPALPEGTGRPRVERVLLEEGREGVEQRDATTGELLARHQGNIHQQSRELGDAAALLERDLEALGSLLAQWDIEMVLLTYAATPVPEFGRRFEQNDRMSETMLRFAERQGLALVDVRGRFRELVGAGGRGAYFHTPRDDHPNTLGYREVGRMVAEVLLGSGVAAEPATDGSPGAPPGFPGADTIN